MYRSNMDGSKLQQDLFNRNGKQCPVLTRWFLQTHTEMPLPFKPGGNSSFGAQLTICNTDGSFCCGSVDPTDCCSSSSRIFLPAISTSKSLPPSSTTTSSSSTTVSTSTTMTTSASPHSESPNRRTTIGISVGISVGFAVFVAILVTLLFNRYRRRKRQNIVGTQLVLQADVHEIDGYPKVVVARDGMQSAELGNRG